MDKGSAFTQALEEVKEKASYKVSEMPYQYWIWFSWETIKEVGEEEPRYLYCGIRPIEEAADAKRQMDAWLRGG